MSKALTALGHPHIYCHDDTLTSLVKIGGKLKILKEFFEQ